MKNKKTTLFPFLSFMLCASALVIPIALAQASTIPLPTGSGLPNPIDTTGQGPVVQVVGNVLGWILTVFLLLAIISFVITGIQYLLSFGSTFSAENAKRNFVYSTIAVAVVGGALIITYTIERLLT